MADDKPSRKQQADEDLAVALGRAHARGRARDLDADAMQAAREWLAHIDRPVPTHDNHKPEPDGKPCDWCALGKETLRRLVREA